MDHQTAGAERPQGGMRVTFDINTVAEAAKAAAITGAILASLKERSEAVQTLPAVRAFFAGEAIRTRRGRKPKPAERPAPDAAAVLAEPTEPAVDDMRRQLGEEGLKRGFVWVRAELLGAGKYSKLSQLPGEEVARLWRGLRPEAA